MVPRLRYIAAFLIQYQAADIIVTAGKKVQANAPRTTEPAKNYGMSVKKWLALDRHKVKCSNSELLLNKFVRWFHEFSLTANLRIVFVKLTPC